MLGNQRVAQLIQAKRLTPQGKIIGLQRKLTVGADADRLIRATGTESSVIPRWRVERTPDEQQAREEQRDTDRGDRRSTDRRRNRQKLGVRDPFDDFDSDWAGRKLLGHYLNGRGRDANIHEEPEWTAYMERSDKLRQGVYRVVLEIANDMAGKGRDGGFPGFKRFHAEVENGEGIIGYQYLHGTNKSVGDFTVSGWGSVEHFRGPNEALVRSQNPFVPPQRVKRGPGARVDLDLMYVWNDIIDPNSSYFTDTVKSAIAEFFTLGRAENYRIAISWKEKCSVWLATSGAVQITGGYPAWH